MTEAVVKRRFLKFILIATTLVVLGWLPSSDVIGEELGRGDIALLNSPVAIEKGSPGDSNQLPKGALVRVDQVAQASDGGLIRVTSLTPPYQQFDVEVRTLTHLNEAVTNTIVVPPGHFSPEDDKTPALIRLHPSPRVVQAWQQLSIAIAENEALQPSEQLPEPYFARGELWLALGAPSEALADYLHGIELARLKGRDLDSYERFRSGISKALEGLAARPVLPAIVASRDLSPIAYRCYARGCNAYQDKDFHAAMLHFSNAIQVDPRQPHYWYYRAFVHKQLGDDVLAQRDALLGAHAEAYLGRTSRDRVTTALRYQQGNLRAWLEEFRLGDPRQKLLSQMPSAEN